MKRVMVFLILNSCLVTGSQLASADDNNPLLQEMARRMDRLESENQRLSEEVSRLKTEGMPPAPTFSGGHHSAVPSPATWSDDSFNNAIFPAACEQSVSSISCTAGESDSGSGSGSSANGYPTVRLTGFFQADGFWSSQDAANRNAIVNGQPLGDIQNGADFRRARLAAVGDVWDNVGYMVEFDFASPGRPNFMDVWLDLRDLPVGTLRVGQWRQPFGMDALTSAKELTFLERALPNAFIPFRQIGVGLSDHNEDWRVTWAGSVFRYPVDFFGGDVGDNGGYGFSGRLTWLVLEGDDNQTLHVGGNYCFADPSNDLLQFRNQPELFVGESTGPLPPPTDGPANLPPFVDTGLISANNFNLFGAELAGSYGSFLAQSEVLAMSVYQMGGQPTANFWGAYAQLSYVLTGEVRPYNKAGGVYTRVVPNKPFGTGPCSGCGAWEIAGRWSTIDLTDQNILGNELQDWTLGLNWYLNKYTKFQFNYIRPNLDSAVTGTSHADLLAVRAQLDF
jgi:phosphate-selective porin OprO/OprP